MTTNNTLNIAIYSKSGLKSDKLRQLNENIFQFSPKNHQLLKEAYLSYLDNARENLAVTKTRGQVRGGGKKPWRQKGTGRARVGSSRNPIWRSGGSVFGPTGQENYSRRLTTKNKRIALKQALSLSLTDNKIILLEDLIIKTAKTNDFIKLINKLKLTREKILIVVEKKTVEIIMASRNIPNVKVVTAKFINTFDVINADHIVITNSALDVISSWLDPENES